jgi:colanic acid biosynthesis glycosyl transferase WcaI
MEDQTRALASGGVSRRPTILVLNQYYRPGVEATAHLLGDLCTDLASDHELTVVTGRVRGREDLPARETVDGVHVIRAWSTSFDRASLWRRALNYLTYLASTLARALAMKRADVVLCMTDPPIVGSIAYVAARRHRAPLIVVSQDVFPETATALRRLTNPLVVSLLGKSVAFYLKRADRLVAIGDRMRTRLIDKGARADRVVVIPNWVDTDAIKPVERENAWAREMRLEDLFVVMHSGNVGHAQNLDNLVHASSHLRDLDDLYFPIVGFGARSAEVSALAERLGADHVFFVPYQPRERLSESLSSADVHYVGLAPGLSGYVVPSRIYGILAAGRPVIAAVPDDCETAALVREAECGVVVAPDDPRLLADTIRSAHSGDLDLKSMGRRGRDYVERNASRSVAMAAYRSLVDEVLRS